MMVTLPEVANLIPEQWTLNLSGHTMPAHWTVWLALTQVCAAGVCLIGAYAPRNYALRASLTAAALWYWLQGLDEALAGNFFINGKVEYAVLSAYALLIAIHIKRHERESSQ